MWEYKIESVEDSVFDRVMHRIGSEGWEIASARRAVSGEGSSSRGVYEVIFKRPATKTQIKENDKKLQAEARDSALESAQILAKLNIGSINRAQQVSYLEKTAFASTIEELELSLKSETEHYVYSINADSSKSLVTATAKSEGMKSYTGAVFIIQEQSETTTVTVTCEIDAPSKIPPESPKINGSKPVCPAGSSKIN